jgi:hypothetical protein
MSILWFAEGGVIIDNLKPLGSFIENSGIIRLFIEIDHESWYTIAQDKADKAKIRCVTLRHQGVVTPFEYDAVQKIL